MGEAWDAAENKPASPLDRGLYDCARDRRICLLGAVCPCVLIGRTAEFVGDDYWTCCSAWCCLEMPCCIGAVLRRRLYVAMGYDPPSFAVACLWNHCLCAPCSICQEARLVAAKTRNIELKGAVQRMER